MKKYLRMPSAAVVIGTLRVKIPGHVDIRSSCQAQLNQVTNFSSLAMSIKVIVVYRDMTTAFLWERKRYKILILLVK